MRSNTQRKSVIMAATFVAVAVVAAPSAGLAQAAQETPAPPVPSDWHPFSRSAVRIYILDVSAIVTEGDVKRVTIAKAPLTGEAGDYAHATEIVEFRCAAAQSRSVVEIEHGPDGAPTDRYDEPSDWDAYSPNSRDGFLSRLVCEDERASPPTWPSIKAWVDAGRK